MATLITIGSLADYPAQLTAFEDFLSNFKSSATESSATAALQGLNIDDDALSDEYDFLDDAGDQTRPRGRRDAKRKYMDILQKVSNRELDEICIELDDLAEVRCSQSSQN